MKSLCLSVALCLSLAACSGDPATSEPAPGSGGTHASGSGGKADGIGGESGSAAGGTSAGGSAGESGASGAAGSADAGSDAPLQQACSELDPREVPAEIAVLPDAGEAPFVNALSGAQKSIDVMVYQMGYGGVLDTLTQKAKSGIKVRVILDLSQQSVNQKYFDALTSAGAVVEWSDPGFTYMHAKLIVVDGEVGLISTGNYLKSFLLKERNYLITDRDPWDVANLQTLFDADFARTSPALDCTRLLVSPINARARILSLINGASSTLVIESMQFADTAVRNAVVARKTAGVDVRVLLAAPSWIDSNQAAATFLASNGIPARWLSTPTVHVKAMVADGARAYAGSENLSYTSLNKNREVGAVMTEAPAVAAIVSTFEKDWASATPF